MSNENQAVEGDNQKAPETEVAEAEVEATAEAEAEQIAAAKNKIPFFNEEASVVEEGGEIDLLINALYEACCAKNIPFVGAINHSAIDESEGFSVGVRGIQVIGKGGFAPANLFAMHACMENKELSELVLSIARDPMKMKMITILGNLG